MTDQKSKVSAAAGPRPIGAAILSAAMALPGLCPGAAQAESAPEGSIAGLRYLNYQDSQPGLKRITASSPSFLFMTPIAGQWSIAGTLTSDTVSGASPRWHSAISSASIMHDRRAGADVKVTRYFARSSFTLGTAYSTEHDYESRALSLLGRFSSEDNNTTWSFGSGFSSDRINPVNNIVTNEHKRTIDWLAGVTQARASESRSRG